MEMYLYNGLEMPALPQYDTAVYEAGIFNFGSGGYILVLQKKGYGFRAGGGKWDVCCGNDLGPEDPVPIVYIYKFSDIEAGWGYQNDGDTFCRLILEPSFSQAPVRWTNTAEPVRNTDTGEILITASEPVPVGGGAGMELPLQYFLRRRFDCLPRNARYQLTNGGIFL